MLQQTPVVRVEPAWRSWMARWPTPADLAAASTADVLRAWDRLGYPRRALRLQECARAVVERHGGVVPSSEPELLALPGVGSYTAAAVLAFAYGRRSVVLDTNVRRVLARTVDGVALPGTEPDRRRGPPRDAVRPRRRRDRRPLGGGVDGARRAGVHGALAALRRLPGAGRVRLVRRGPARRRARRPPPDPDVRRAPTARCAAA